MSGGGEGGGAATFVTEGARFRTVEVVNVDSVEKIRGVNLHRLVWCGDFNRHGTLWGSEKKKKDLNGNIVDLLDVCDLVCVNYGRETRVGLAKGTFSAVVLTTVTLNLAACVGCIGSNLNRY